MNSHQRSDFIAAQLAHDEAEPENYEAREDDLWDRADEQYHIEREES